MNRRKLSIGIKTILGFNIVNIILWSFGQTYAVFNYDIVASWGLQDARDLIDPVLVQVNRGIGIADTFILVFLFIPATIGLFRYKFYGAVLSWMAYGFSVYWPLVYWGSQFLFAKEGVKHQVAPLENHIILAIIVSVSTWASWYLFKHYKELDQD